MGEYINPTARPPKKVYSGTRPVQENENHEAGIALKIKGYKKIRKRIKKLSKEAKQLNKELERTAELKDKLF